MYYVTLAHLGRIGPGEHRLETPVGVVTVHYTGAGKVTFDNVPSYRTQAAVTVNVTCTSCRGEAQCHSCQAAARALAAAGHDVVFSFRYDSLRAAAANAYRFQACIVTLNGVERSIADALERLLQNVRVAVVYDGDDAAPPALSQSLTVIPKSDYDNGTFALDWLNEPNAKSAPPAIDAPIQYKHRRTDDRQRQQRRIQLLRAVILHEGAQLRIIAPAGDGIVDLLTRGAPAFERSDR